MSPAEFMQLVQRAQAPEFWFVTVIALLLATAAGWGALRFLARKRVIEDMPTALIRSAPQGYIELQGMADLMDGDEIFAPLSTRRCVWFSYKVEKREERSRGNGRGGNSWSTIEQGRSEDLFYLVDTTGRCAVDPEGAAVTAGHNNVWYGTSRIPGRYHESDGVWWARAMGAVGKPYRYTERRIEPGDALYAIGNFTTHGGAAARFDVDGAVGDKLREWKRDSAFMLRHFDADGDGQIDLDEWQAARDKATAEIMAEQEHAVAPPPVDVLARTGDRRRPFVIHAGTEDEIIRRCTRYAAGLAMVSVPLFVLALWALVLRFGS